MLAFMPNKGFGASADFAAPPKGEEVFPAGLAKKPAEGMVVAGGAVGGVLAFPPKLNENFGGAAAGVVAAVGKGAEVVPAVVCGVKGAGGWLKRPPAFIAGVVEGGVGAATGFTGSPTGAAEAAEAGVAGFEAKPKLNFGPATLPVVGTDGALPLNGANGRASFVPSPPDAGLDIAGAFGAPKPRGEGLAGTVLDWPGVGIPLNLLKRF